MSSPPRIPALSPEALAELPVFPLANVTLFPGAMMPLHIFEGRYRHLVRAAIDGHRCIAIARLLDPTRQLADDAPFDPIAGLGVIAQAVELPDGRFHLLLHGTARVRLVEHPFVAPFRRASATLRTTTNDVEQADLLAIDSIARSFGATLLRLNPSFQLEIPPLELGGDEEGYVDALAAVFVMDADARQDILTAESLARRAELLLGALATQHAEIASSPGLGGGVN
jgi:ATP-dependent Lon protease